MKKLFVVILAVISISAFAVSKSEKLFSDVMLSYQRGDYYDAINGLGKTGRYKKYQAVSYYWKGICYSKLQEFDKAIINYKKAIKLKSSPEDIYYQLGQAFFASSKREEAREAFKQSVLRRFKVAESFYYIGTIDFELKNYDSAINYFSRVGEVEDISDDMNQSGQFMLGESYLGKIEKYNKRVTKTVRKKVMNFVIPYMKEALNVDYESDMAGKIYKRLEEVRKKYRIRKKTFINGKAYPEKRFTLWLSEKISYDSNVILESSDAEASTTAVNKDSLIFNTSAFVNSTAVHKRRFVFAPELFFLHTYHSRQSDYSIYQNDSISIAPALKNRLEHTIFSRPASILFNLEFDMTSRKRNAPVDKSLHEYGKTTAVVLGEKLQFSESSYTTFDYKYSSFAAYDVALNTKTHRVSVDHQVMLPNNDTFIIYAKADFIKAKTSFSDSDEYYFRFDWMGSEYWKGFDLALAMAVTMVDTKKQKTIRGTEMVYNPSVTLSKTLKKKWDIVFGYNFTQKTSKQKTIYAYYQHVFDAGIKYNFY
ncbi:MAG: tetratricopeptide repeat protein [Bacteriovoracaceae bacterium]|nr:tetratricopeptide repeat protein [Bacteriovoracaceae bacterium]